LPTTTVAGLTKRFGTGAAVDDLSFEISGASVTGFLGPNGAGKTTTLKVLSGLLHPTSGEVEVAGHVPYRREAELLGKITLVMGQKSQLIWDLPPSETYAMNRAIFDVPQAQFDKTLGELTELLELGSLVDKPTRQLSLGERMKCELAAALLHHPTTLFLDEPTIGLDVAMQVAIRDFVRSYNQRHEATVILTSHYMDDVVALCPRIIVIDQGALIHDGDLRQLIKTMDPDKRVSFTLVTPVSDEDIAKLGTVISREVQRITLKVAEGNLPGVIGHLLGTLKAADLAIEDPPLEDILREMFGKNHKKHAAAAEEPAE
jgi:ABC-2 type transport system ATP-binding protein